jgi:beta-galactosidase/beta-glucuronidase
MRTLNYLLLILTLMLWASCSHKFDSNVHSLDFYQWNLWQDTGARQGDELPSCGWDDLHRGMGVLVRIPASPESYFPDMEESSVFWYHCRFTLPEQWKEKPVSLVLEGAGPFVKLYLNQELLASFHEEGSAYELDVSEVIYYTRDNHLSIRISNPRDGIPGKINGITGNILVKTKEN